MLLRTKDIKAFQSEDYQDKPLDPSRAIKQGKPAFIANDQVSLTSAIGELINGREHHFYSWGNFNLVRLICFLLKQTGPAHLMMTSYSFSRKSIEQLQNRIDKRKFYHLRLSWTTGLG
jgi:hypothetical protein